MAMSIGGNARQKAEINVTPMIDVLLVLLIIFMVILPTSSNGLNTLAPQPPRNDQKDTPPTEIVITVNSDKTIRLNQQSVALSDLAQRLRDVFKDRAPQPIFVKAAPDLEFGDVAVVIDIVKGVGLNRIALITMPM